MSPDDRVRMRHMADACEAALRLVNGRSRVDLDDDQANPKPDPAFFFLQCRACAGTFGSREPDPFFSLEAAAKG